MENSPQEIKEALIGICRERLHEAYQKSNAQMESLRTALGSEVKSSAGDKHETGRAMIQLEMERTASRMEQQENQLQVFERQVAARNDHGAIVAPGCLVVTDKGMYFIAVSLGPVAVLGHMVPVLSPMSPIGQLLKGKKVGEVFEFKGNPARITAIV
ncbi:3-oxoacyl-ACP synthase [Robertkochia sediminum]|uniref:3-oxoacyl-ACP synthase n=1 Tax=Robertkochia sediminum TaxID=2785326 RepID=UPI0019326465|nr:3-oxoacyl-ACP synthase [Robertkochia sediminum]MBL7471333.1 3-oxoacyl-ACP synthase [Robertkochia sediminum]